MPLATVSGLPTPDRIASPLAIDEQSGEHGPDASTSRFRCSDKGFLPLRLPTSLELLDWTTRALATGKRGSTPQDALLLFARLGIEPKTRFNHIG